MRLSSVYSVAYGYIGLAQCLQDQHAKFGITGYIIFRISGNILRTRAEFALEWDFDSRRLTAEIIGFSGTLARPMNEVVEGASGSGRFYLDLGNGQYKRMYDRVVIRNKRL